jgi:hypothetical protein
MRQAGLSKMPVPADSRPPPPHVTGSKVRTDANGFRQPCRSICSGTPARGRAGEGITCRGHENPLQAVARAQDRALRGPPSTAKTLQARCKHAAQGGIARSHIPPQVATTPGSPLTGHDVSTEQLNPAASGGCANCPCIVLGIGYLWPGPGHTATLNYWEPGAAIWFK